MCRCPGPVRQKAEASRGRLTSTSGIDPTMPAVRPLPAVRQTAAFSNRPAPCIRIRTALLRSAMRHTTTDQARAHRQQQPGRAQLRGVYRASRRAMQTRTSAHPVVHRSTGLFGPQRLPMRRMVRRDQARRPNHGFPAADHSLTRLQTIAPTLRPATLPARPAWAHRIVVQASLRATSSSRRGARRRPKTRGRSLPSRDRDTRTSRRKPA